MQKNRIWRRGAFGDFLGCANRRMGGYEGCGNASFHEFTCPECPLPAHSNHAHFPHTSTQTPHAFDAKESGEAELHARLLAEYGFLPGQTTKVPCDCGNGSFYLFKLSRQGNPFLACPNYRNRDNPGCKAASAKKITDAPVNIVASGKSTDGGYDMGASALARAEDESGVWKNKSHVKPPLFAQRIHIATTHIAAAAIFPPINHSASDPAGLDHEIPTRHSDVDAPTSHNAALANTTDTRQDFWYKSESMEDMTRAGAVWASQLVKSAIEDYDRTLLKPSALLPTVFSQPPTLIELAAILWFSGGLESAGLVLPKHVRRGIDLEISRQDVEAALDHYAAAHVASTSNGHDGGADINPLPYHFNPLDVLDVSDPLSPLFMLPFGQDMNKQTSIEWHDPIGRLKYGFDFRFMMGAAGCSWSNVKIVPLWQDVDGDHNGWVALQLADNVPNTAGWLMGSADFLLIPTTINPSPSCIGEWLMVDAGKMRRLVLSDLPALAALPTSGRQCTTTRLTLGDFHSTKALSDTIDNTQRSSCPVNMADQCGTCAGGACVHLGTRVRVMPDDMGNMMDNSGSVPAATAVGMDGGQAYEQHKWLGIFQKVNATDGFGCDVHLMCPVTQFVAWAKAHPDELIAK